MGIAKLTKHLSPFSEPVILGNAPTSEAKLDLVSSVVIDGPSLVYHVYHRLLSWTPWDPCFSLDVQPTCNEVSVGVINYLLQLSNSGIRIQKICFDGGLPTSKRDVRLLRLEKSRSKLELFCSNTRNTSLRMANDVQTRQLEVGPDKVLRSRRSPSGTAMLPENPFMVSSVYEDLKLRWDRESICRQVRPELCSIFESPQMDFPDFPWRDLTVMVRGEADAECACVARLTGSAILTNDSDLLLYDLGAQGSVVFLDSLELVRWEPGRPRDAEIRARRLSPNALSERLGIISLTRFAYELTRSPDSSLAQLILRSKDPVSKLDDPRVYFQFAEEYGACSAFEDVSMHTTHLPQILDARVSELLLQFESGRRRSEENPRIYLPILIEDHTRRCAWEAGRFYRLLAYNILNLSYGISEKFEVMEEIVRRGPRLVSSQERLRDEAYLEYGMKSALELITSIEASCHAEIASFSFWRVFALVEIYQRRIVSELPTPSHLSRLIKLGFMGNRLEWSDIHLNARIQSVLYSLRILKQVLMYAKDLSDSSRRLKQMLDGLPGLHELMQSRRELARNTPSEDIIGRFISCFFSVGETRSEDSSSRILQDVEPPITTLDEAKASELPPPDQHHRHTSKEIKTRNANAQNTYTLLTLD